MSRPFQKVTCVGYERCQPGKEAINLKPGDFILTHGNAWTSKLIRIGQSLRFHGHNRKYAHWNHAAIIITKSGEIIEALGAGIKKQHISKYRPEDYYLVRIKASSEDRRQVVNFAMHSLDQKYGFATIASIAISLTTGLKLSFGFDGEQICSGLVARAMERTWAIFNKTPSHITPADLARYYDVRPLTKTDRA